jgi:hypothetical protein
MRKIHLMFAGNGRMTAEQALGHSWRWWPKGSRHVVVAGCESPITYILWIWW